MGIASGAAKAVGSGLLNSVTGGCERAFLVVDDCRALAAAASGSGGASGALNRAADALQAARAVSRRAASAAGAALSGAAPVGIRDVAAPKYFQVQFNPSELSLSSSLLPERKKGLQRGTGGQELLLSQSDIRPRTTLSLNLYFDDTNLADAFLGDKFNTGLGGSASMLTNAVSLGAALGGRVWSVQPQVEALTAALRNSCTRSVTFCWGEFSFSGHLTHVEAEYTLFSTSGRPVRAKVGLRVFQELDPSGVGAWYQSFLKAFGDTGAVSLVKTAQKVSSLVNLNL